MAAANDTTPTVTEDTKQTNDDDDEEQESKAKETQVVTEGDEDVAFTARLMAYSRSLENKEENPLMTDPFADALTGDLTEYLAQHPRNATKMDYAIIRSYYIEQTLIKQFKSQHKTIQIVSFGAGLDTKPYRLEYLDANDSFFEIDVATIHKYKAKILDEKLKAKPLCKMKRITINLEKTNDADTMQLLVDNGFDATKPVFWLMEGLVMYMTGEAVQSLLSTISAYCTIGLNEIFLDISPFGKSKMGVFKFQWGISIQKVPAFMAENGDWEAIECTNCSKHNHGRYGGGMCWFHGRKIEHSEMEKRLKALKEAADSLPDAQQFADKLLKVGLPQSAVRQKMKHHGYSDDVIEQVFSANM